MINNNLSEEDIIKKYNNDWFEISRHQYLTEDFIRKYQDELYWYYISTCQILSEDFIIEFKEKVYWKYIFIYQKLSEKFIIEHVTEYKDKVDWEYISWYKNLSLQFIKDNIDNLSIEKLLCNENISKEIKQELKMYFDILE